MDNPNYSYSMSRSSSGPGVAVEDYSDYGLGIVPFHGQIRFGDHHPFSVEEARRRTLELKGRLARDQESCRDKEQRRIDPSGIPYPDERSMMCYPEVNLIPTQSSLEAMRRMVDERGR